MEYKVTFENGMTIINTGYAGGKQNKTGHKGITRRPNRNYSAVLQYAKNKRVYLGEFKTIEEAAAIYAEAEQHLADGTLLQWAETLYGVTKRRRKPSKEQSK